MSISRETTPFAPSGEGEVRLLLVMQSHLHRLKLLGPQLIPDQHMIPLVIRSRQRVPTGVLSHRQQQQKVQEHVWQHVSTGGGAAAPLRGSCSFDMDRN